MIKYVRRVALGLLLSAGASGAYAQCIPVSNVDVPMAQNFDSLATSGITNALAIPGWQLLETGGGARDNDQYGADTGASNTGDTYSYGAASATDRALGSLRSGSLVASYGACYTNNTGAAITALDIAYTGEQWRLGAITRPDRLDFQYSLDATDLATGTWVDVDALDFTNPATTGTAGARDGNDAANRTARSANIGSLSIASGETVWIRWSDADATSSDDGLAIDDFALIARGSGGGGQPTLSIADTSAAEGDSGTSPFFFTVTLSSAAGAGGVSFDYATADGTAAAGSDYVSASSSATIAAGATSVTLSVAVNGDTDSEPSETFLVNVTNIAGALAGDVQGQGTINNDDFTIVPIHAIQGAGAMSPLVGQTLTTLGIVTGRKSNGFFLQTSDVEGDGNDATSQGVFVFTGSAPPANAAVGDRVQVTGTVVEYVPTQDLGQLPLTELGGTISVNLLSIGNALPTPVALSNTFPDPAGALDQLEPLEGMRVTAPSFTVVAPTGGSTDENDATGSTNGIFNVVVTGTARPFREPGIQRPDAPPAGSIPPIPQWDFNPELLTVVSRGIGGAPLDVAVGAQLANFVGPLDYGFRRYTIVPDPAIAPTITAGPAPSAARLPTADEFTVASYNVERFFDTVNDPAVGEPVLTAPAFTARLNKASLGIRNFLNTPDIIGLVEVENLAALQALATKINDDAVAASLPNPEYVAYLQEGNDVGGIDVGFLVKTGEIAAGIDRIDVNAVTQLGLTEMWTEPAGGSSLLNDRPPLQLDAVVNYADGRSFPITVIVVHQRSLNGADGNDANGERVRAKRQKQAEYLANQVQALQDGDPARGISVIGDFNAFEFNDGFVDAMNVVTGTPTPDNQTVVAGDGVDLVDPDLLNLFSLEPVDQRYSFVFDGNAQSLDHVLINQALGAAVSGYSLDHARINADFPEVNRNDANSPSRLSDHDPAITYFSVSSADLSVTASASPANVVAGQAMTFGATVLNQGPNAAAFPGVGFAFDAELANLGVTAPAGWTCDTPTVANGTTVLACSAATLADAASAVFQLTATAPANEAGNAITMIVLATSQTPDPDADDNDAQAAVNVDTVADLSVMLTGPALLSRNSTSATFVATTSSGGPDSAVSPVVALSINVPKASVSLVAPAGWDCVASQNVSRLAAKGVPTGTTFAATCSATGATPAAGSFSMTINNVGRLRIPNIDVRAEIQSQSIDPQPGNNVATKRTRVAGVTGF